jgi:hypothetical protein
MMFMDRAIRFEVALCIGQDVAHRRPYEGLILARPAATSSLSSPGDQAVMSWMHAQQPKAMVILAVPGEHSRKPHLGRLLRLYLPEQPACLEVCP